MVEPEDSPVLAARLSFGPYKSFRQETNRLNDIYPINVIIGKNNIGKSALLELIEYLVNPKESIDALTLLPTYPPIYCRFLIEPHHILQAVPPGLGGGNIPGEHQSHCLTYVGNEVCLVLNQQGEGTYHEEGLAFPDEYRKALASQFVFPLRGRTVSSIAAERDIRPEGANTPFTRPNGEGVTNSIRWVLNQRSQNSALIDVELLNAFNEVVDRDSKVSRLTVQEDENGMRWEIFLQSEGGIPIAISDSGSGLKTILFTCFRLRVTPPLAQLPLSHYVFLFEELENNIHPGLLRKLFALVRKVAIESNSYVFLATHSSVVLDLFSSDPMAQIIHVTKENDTANFRVIDNHYGLREILNDLDIRASDLLQSNGVIWVEGPSDRLYLNRLIDLVSDGELKEGLNYQIVFYGGRLLSHVTTDSENDELVNLLHVNRNAYVVVDRDTEPINSTKERVISEVIAGGGGAWVTSRKEIECDLPSQPLMRLYSEITDSEMDQLEGFDTFLARFPGEATKLYRRSKAQFAKKFAAEIARHDIEATPELLNVIEQLCVRIRFWNQSSPSA